MEPVIGVISFVLLFMVMAAAGGHPLGAFTFIWVLSNILFGLWLHDDEVGPWQLRVAICTVIAIIIFSILRFISCGIMGQGFFPLTSCM